MGKADDWTGRITWMLVALLLVGSVEAIPTPHGLDGFVLNLEGEQSPAGTTVHVTNLATGQTISGGTGMGPYSGRYSVAIEGIDGDMVLINVSSGDENTNMTVVLNGSMHNVNVYLNISGQGPSIQDVEIYSSTVSQVVAITGLVLDEDVEDEEVVLKNLDTGERVLGRKGSGGYFFGLIEGKRDDRIAVEYKGDDYSDGTMVFEQLNVENEPLVVIYSAERGLERIVPGPAEREFEEQVFWPSSFSMMILAASIVLAFLLMLVVIRTGMHKRRR